MSFNVARKRTTITTSHVDKYEKAVTASNKAELFMLCAVKKFYDFYFYKNGMFEAVLY